MQLKRRKEVRLSRQSLLDVLRVLMKDRLAAGNDLRNDRESITGGGLRVDGTVLTLFQVFGLFGYCHCLRLDLHSLFSLSDLDHNYFCKAPIPQLWVEPCGDGL